MSYIAKKSCGCIVAAIVDRPERKNETAREVSKWIRDGLAVERVTVEYVRENLKSCPHEMKPHAAVQKELLE